MSFYKKLLIGVAFAGAVVGFFWLIKGPIPAGALAVAFLGFLWLVFFKDYETELKKKREKDFRKKYKKI